MANPARISDFDNNPINGGQSPFALQSENTIETSHQMIFGPAGSFGNCPIIPPKHFYIWHTLTPYFQWKSFTFFISIIELIIYFISVFIAYVPANELSPTGITLLNFGAVFGPFVKKFEIWRLFTATFLHASFYHILFNLIAQAILGFAIERHYGFLKYGIIYILMAISGNIVHAGASFCVVAVGCSTSIFGLFMLSLGELLVFFNQIGNMSMCMYHSVILLVTLFLLTPIIIPQAAFFAHLGGAISGIFASFALNYKTPNKVSWYKYGLIATFVIWASSIAASLWSIWGKDHDCL